MEPAKPERKHIRIEETSVFRKFEEIASRIWHLVDGWPSYAKWTLGKQLTEAADSVGFNLVEGDGRYSDAEAIHFFHIARGSARETKLGVARALDRKLITRETATELECSIEAGLGELNGLINYRRQTKNVRAVREPEHNYNS